MIAITYSMQLTIILYTRCETISFQTCGVYVRYGGKSLIVRSLATCSNCQGIYYSIYSKRPKNLGMHACTTIQRMDRRACSTRRREGCSIIRAVTKICGN